MNANPKTRALPYKLVTQFEIVESPVSYDSDLQPNPDYRNGWVQCVIHDGTAEPRLFKRLILSRREEFSREVKTEIRFLIQDILAVYAPGPQPKAKHP